MLEDKELREIFEQETTQHLGEMEASLLGMGGEEPDRVLVDKLFRHCHSLKGAARMLKIESLEKLSHAMEDLMGTLREDPKAFAPMSLRAALLLGVDKSRVVIQDALQARPCSLNLMQAVSELLETASRPAAASAVLTTVTVEPGVENLPEKPANGGPPAAPAADSPAPVTAGPGPNGPRAPAPPRISSRNREVLPESSSRQDETIRVEGTSLDRLMEQVGELTATRTRLRSDRAEARRLVLQWTTQKDAIPAELSADLEQLAKRLDEDCERLEHVWSGLKTGVQDLRMLPVQRLFRGFKRMIHDLSLQTGKDVELITEGEDLRADKGVLEELRDPLVHLLRNAVDHGLETPDEREAAGKPRRGQVLLRAKRGSEGLQIECIDDGRGLDPDKIARAALANGIVTREQLDAMPVELIVRLIFTGGFSTREQVTDLSGRGVGLDVVLAQVESLKGSVDVFSKKGLGTTFVLQVPFSVATARVLLAELGGRYFAFPVESVITTRLLKPGELLEMDDGGAILMGDQPVPAATLRQLLGLPAQQRAPGESWACLVLQMGDARAAILVDSLNDELEIVVRPLGALLQRVRHVSGATLLASGAVCLVLNARQLIETASRSLSGVVTQRPPAPEKKKLRVLLVEDSLTVRTQEKRILEGAGYHVTIAIDGLDAMGKLATDEFDAVVSDIEMPNMDGLTLTEKIRAHPRLRSLPVILVTSLGSEEARRRGMEAGADAYIPKASFSHQILLASLERLL